MALVKTQLDAPKIQPLIEEMKRFPQKAFNPIEQQSTSIERIVQFQIQHGTPEGEASVLINSHAQELGVSLIDASPLKKVLILNKIVQRYSKYAPNVINQLLRLNSIPKEYQFLILLNPYNIFIADAVYALNNQEIDSHLGDDKINKRISLAMHARRSIIKPETSVSTRAMGTIYAEVYKIFTGREVYPTYANTGLFGTPSIFDPINTSPDMKLSALFNSYLGVGTYNTEVVFDVIETTIKKLANFYYTFGLSEDDALKKAVDAFAGQYDMIFYQGRVIRLRKGYPGLGNVINLLKITPFLLKEIDWQYPALNKDTSHATDADRLDYLNSNILKGHWATDPGNQGLVWINANGYADKMKNGGLLYISFDSIKKLTPKEFHRFIINALKNRSFSTEKYIVNSRIGWLNIPVQDERWMPYGSPMS